MELKHIRMPKEEVAKVEAYRIKNGLTFTMAVRVLLAMALTAPPKMRKSGPESA